MAPQVHTGAPSGSSRASGNRDWSSWRLRSSDLASGVIGGPLSPYRSTSGSPPLVLPLQPQVLWCPLSPPLEVQGHPRRFGEVGALGAVILVYYPIATPKDAIGETTKECPDHLAELPEGPYNFPGDIPRSTGPSACFWRSCTTRLLIFDSEIPFISPISQRRGNKLHWKGTPILLQTHQ